MSPYRIAYDPARHLIRYRIEGFWKPATVDAFGRELAEAIARAVTLPKPRMLGDASAFAVQGSDVTQAFEELMLTRIVPRVDRFAVVVAKVLNKLQVERGTGASGVHIFLSEDEALEWLDGEHP